MRKLIDLIEQAAPAHIIQNVDTAVDEDDEFNNDLPWSARWASKSILPRGLILYHGTADRFENYEVSGPMWFSTSKEVALFFAKRAGKKFRIMQFELTDDLMLPRIDGPTEMSTFAEMFYIETMGVEDMRDSVQSANLPGWYIPANYHNGDDILITHPEQFVR